VLFINILDSLTAPCLVYNTDMYTVYNRCGQYGRCMFIHWPVQPVWPARGLYGPDLTGTGDRSVNVITETQIYNSVIVIRTKRC